MENVNNIERNKNIKINEILNRMNIESNNSRNSTYQNSIKKINLENIYNDKYSQQI